MSMVTFYTRNILETGTTTITGDADTGYPESRIYDRSQVLYWKDTVTEVKSFHVNQGSSVGTQYSVDSLIIAKHNFNGYAMQWQWSTNNSTWTDAVTDWTQSDDNLIIKTMTSAATKQYWQVTLTSAPNPYCTEVFFSKANAFNVLAQGPSGRDIENVTRITTVGGSQRSIKRGPKRRTRSYTLMLSSANMTTFEDMMDELGDYLKPFYVKDHKSETYFAQFDEPPSYDFSHPSYVRVNVSFTEVI